MIHKKKIFDYNNFEEDIETDDKTFNLKLKKSDDKKDKKLYGFNITRNKAIEIALNEKNLMKDFYKKTSLNVNFANLKPKDIDVVLYKYKDQKCWKVNVNSAEVSELQEDDSLIDRKIGRDSKETKYLSCLVDVESGEYKYYSL